MLYVVLFPFVMAFGGRSPGCDQDPQERERDTASVSECVHPGKARQGQNQEEDPHQESDPAGTPVSDFYKSLEQ